MVLSVHRNVASHISGQMHFAVGIFTRYAPSIGKVMFIIVTITKTVKPKKISDKKAEINENTRIRTICLFFSFIFLFWLFFTDYGTDDSMN